MIKFLTQFFRPAQSGSSNAGGGMGEFSTALDLGRTRILCLEGAVRSGKILLNQIALIPISLDSSLVTNLKVLFEQQTFSKDSVHFSLKSPQVVTRFLRFPKMTDKELRGVLQYEIEQYVPYEAKDLYLDLAVLQESIKTEQGESTEIFVAVTKKEPMDTLMKQFQEAQVVVDSVDVDILACMKSLKFFHPEDFSGHVAILDIGVQVTTLGVLRQSQPRFIRDLSFGAQDIVKKLKSRSGLEEEAGRFFLEGKTNVSETESAAFADCIDGLINDVKVSFDYYRDQSEDGVGVDSLFVCGLGSTQPFILKALERALDIPVKNMDLLAKIELSPKVSPDLLSVVLADAPVALGLLLRDYD